MRKLVFIGLLVIILLVAPAMAKPNLALNGINHIGNQSEWNWFCNATNADEISGLYSKGTRSDVSDVLAATPLWSKFKRANPKMVVTISKENKTANLKAGPYYVDWQNNENNGLTWFEDQGNVSYDTVIAYSGGTRTAMTAIMGNYLDCNRLILISPQGGFRFPWHRHGLGDLEYIRSQNSNLTIIIYQSVADNLPTDLLSGIKFDKGNKKHKQWLKDYRIIVNPGIPEFGESSPVIINGRKISIHEDINNCDHSELFKYISAKLSEFEIC